MDKLRETLQNLEKNKLVELVLELIDTLDNKEKIKFISRKIDSEMAIDAISLGDTLGGVIKIKRFCKECNKGVYYVEDNSYYSFYKEGGDYDSLSNSEWAEKLGEYLEVATMYSRNKEYDISLELFKAIFDTINKGESDCEILGTESPRVYINVDYREIFNEYIKSIIIASNDESRAIEESLDLYIRFGEESEDGIINNIHNVDVFEKVIRAYYMDKSIWAHQALVYNLLIKLYEKSNKVYDKVELAKSFIEYNSNFYVMVINAYAEIENYEECISISEKSLELVSDYWVRDSIINILIDSCVKINDMKKAFKYAKILFGINSNYENYKKVRSLANDEEIIMEFKKEAIGEFEKTQMGKSRIMEILSYEGDIHEIFNRISKHKINEDYYVFKYVVKALIYRALYNEKIKKKNLLELLDKIKRDEENGIIDLISWDEDKENKEVYLNKSVEILKEMVQFHFNAATRNRYSKGAYYCSMIKDVCEILNKQDEFKLYYDNIMRENKRRPALRDEMKKRME